MGKIFEIDHINNPISNSINSVNLTFTFSFLGELNSPTQIDLNPIPVTIEEATNMQTLAGCTSGFQLTNIPCDDRITLTQPSIQLFPVNTPKGDEFLVLELEFPTFGDNFIITQEGGLNVYDISGTFRVAPAPAPFGAVGALSLFATGFRRIRKRYACITSGTGCSADEG